MKKIVIGGALGVSGFIGFRLYMKSQLEAAIIARYQQNPIIAGTALYSAAFGKPGKASKGGIQKAASIIADEMVPLIGFNIPTQQEVVAYVKQKALSNAKNNPKGLVDLGIEQGQKLVRSQPELKKMVGHLFNPVLAQQAFNKSKS